MELHLLEGGVSGFGFKCSSQRWATLRSWRSGFSDIREWLPYNGNGKEEVKKDKNDDLVLKTHANMSSAKN